jgi:hypothetical protein
MLTRHRHVSLIVSGLASGLLALCACSHGSLDGRRIRLIYPPVDAGRTTAVRSNVRVVLLPAQDGRPEPRQIIGRKGAFRAPLSAESVTTSDDVMEWITGAVKLELERAGFTVVPPPSGLAAAAPGERLPGKASEPPSMPVLGLRVDRVYGEFWNVEPPEEHMYKGEIVARVWLLSGKQYPVDRDYIGRGVAPSAAGDSQSMALSNALLELARPLASDVRAALTSERAPDR